MQKLYAYMKSINNILNRFSSRNKLVDVVLIILNA